MKSLLIFSFILITSSDIFSQARSVDVSSGKIYVYKDFVLPEGAVSNDIGIESLVRLNNLGNYYPYGNLIGSKSSAIAGIKAAIGAYGYAESSNYYGTFGDNSKIGSTGVYGEAKGSSYTFGVKGIAFNYSGGQTGIYYGVYGSAQSSGSTATNYGLYGTTINTNSTSYAGYFDGKVHVNGTLSKSAGTFKIDHPLDPQNKYLSHSFVESPDMMNIYNGNITTDQNGRATVRLPDYFEALNMDFRYQLTSIGSPAQAYVFEEVKENQFVIATDKPNIKVSWQVTGVRNDAYAKKNRIVPEEDKPASEKGKYLNADAFGLPREKSLHVVKSSENLKK